MDITFQQFKSHIESQFAHQEKYGLLQLRRGQLLMNVLLSKRPDKYHQITGSHVDCFYDDNKIKDTINYLERHWN